MSKLATILPGVLGDFSVILIGASGGGPKALLWFYLSGDYAEPSKSMGIVILSLLSTSLTSSSNESSFYSSSL
jgi:hypothetical protein